MDNVKEDVRCAKIAMLNDTFRRSGFGVVLAGGVQSVRDLNGLMRAVQTFNRFNESNDPYGERDFGFSNEGFFYQKMTILR